MRLAEGSYCVIEALDDRRVRKTYRSNGTIATFTEHYLHTQVPRYPHLIRALEADWCGYVLPRYPTTAREMVFSNRLPIYTREQSFQVGLQLIYAVEYLHRLGFVHGDVSLANVMLRNRQLVLTDFNLSEFVGWPNRAVHGYRSYLNYYRHYRNTVYGELSAATDWYATAIALSELWGRSLLIQQACYREYRRQLGLLSVEVVQGVPSRSVGLEGDVDDDTKEAVTAAMFIADDRQRHRYFSELRLTGREVEVIETLLNYQPGDDVLSAIKWTGPEPLPDLTQHRASPLYQSAPDEFKERVRFYRDLVQRSELVSVNLDADESMMASLVVDHWFATDKTMYLNRYPLNRMLNPEALLTLRQLTNNDIYGRLPHATRELDDR